MPQLIRHHNIRILCFAPDETVADHCQPGDIALVPDGAQWWVQFVGEAGEIDHYDEPFESYNKALWTAKAAAEFDAE